MIRPPGRVRLACSATTSLHSGCGGGSGGGDHAGRQQRCHTAAMIIISAAAATAALTLSGQQVNPGAWSLSTSAVPPLRSPPARHGFDYDGDGRAVTGAISTTARVTERSGLPPGRRHYSERGEEVGGRGRGIAAERTFGGGVDDAEGMRQLMPLQRQQQERIVPSAEMASRRLLGQVREYGGGAADAATDGGVAYTLANSDETVSGVVYPRRSSVRSDVVQTDEQQTQFVAEARGRSIEGGEGKGAVSRRGQAGSGAAENYVAAVLSSGFRAMGEEGTSAGDAADEEAVEGDETEPEAAADNNGREKEKNAGDLQHNKGVFGLPRAVTMTRDGGGGRRETVEDGDGGQWGVGGEEGPMMQRPANSSQQDDGGKHWYPAATGGEEMGSAEMSRELKEESQSPTSRVSRISSEGEGGKLLDGRNRCFHDNDGRHRCYPTVFFFGTSKCGEFTMKINSAVYSCFLLFFFRAFQALSTCTFWGFVFRTSGRTKPNHRFFFTCSI